MDTNNKTEAEQKNTLPFSGSGKDSGGKVEQKDYSVSEKRRFNFGRLFLGIILLFIGFFYLGQNTGIIPKEFSLNIGQLWPLLIIYFGLSMMDSRGWFSTLLGILCTFFILIIVTCALFIGNAINLGVGQRSDQSIKNISVSIAMDANAVSGAINIKSGVGKIELTGGTEELIEGNLKTNFTDVKRESYIRNGVQTANLEITGGQGNWPVMMSHFANNLSLKVNPEIPLAISLQGGASDISIDSREITLEDLEIDVGASSLDLTLGDKLKDSSIKIKAGASAVKIHLPKNIGAKLTIDEGLSSKKLDKFIAIDGKNYETENYNNSDKKINIEANLGVSSLEIDWQ